MLAQRLTPLERVEFDLHAWVPDFGGFHGDRFLGGSGQTRLAYEEVVAQVTSLVADAHDGIAAMASVAALLKDRFEHFFWVGFYRPAPDGSLVVGPYQGPLACTRLPAGRGVCGASYSRQETIVVPDVHAIEDHIACDARSRSEIVVPIVQSGRVVAVLDVDSDRPDAFGDADRTGLERVAAAMAESRWTFDV